MTLCFRRVPLRDVQAMPQAFNTSNNYETRPDDYAAVCRGTHTRVWVDALHAGQYKRVTLPFQSWMFEASKIGKVNKTFSRLFDDEMEAYLEEHAAAFEAAVDFPPEGLFFRNETVSPKYGVHGAGPYHSLRQVVESMTTGTHGHVCLDEAHEVGPATTLYFLPWLPDLSLDDEYRIFVRSRRVTAISQQNIYRATRKTQAEIEADVRRIVDAFADLEQRLPSSCGDCVIDAAVLPSGRVYFIELNSFGVEYSSGSAAFNWKTDRDVLYGETETPEIHVATVHE